VIRATVAAAGIAAAAYGFPHALRLAEERRLARRCREDRVLVLSYDDGPGPVLTPQLLELLAAHDVRATFFPLGRRAVAAPEILDRVQRAGHEIGCHGYAHRNAWTSSPRAAVQDLEAGYAALAPWVVADGVFRPPYGKLVGPTWLAVRRRRAPLGWWTADSGDTHADLPDPDGVARSVVEAGGGVVLLHDHDREPEWAGREAYVLEATSALLRAAARNGLRTCPLSAVI
jgi:peptidoglycan-N-acetylglucosamine deacetylase